MQGYDSQPLGNVGTASVTEKVEPAVEDQPGAGRGPGWYPWAVAGRVLRANHGRILAVAIFLGAIQFASLFFPPFLLPDVPRVFNALQEILTGQLHQISLSLVRFSVALSLAIAIGWFVGLAMGAFRVMVGELMLPGLNIVQSVPALSWVLVSVLWISSIELRIGFIVFIIGLPFFALNVYEGLRDIDTDIVKAIDQFRPTRVQVMRILLIPQSLVYLLLSVRSAASLCLRILVFAEMIGATSGIGNRMGVALANFRMDHIFAWTIVLVAVNFAVAGLTALVERWVLAWREEAVVR